MTKIKSTKLWFSVIFLTLIFFVLPTFGESSEFIFGTDDGVAVGSTPIPQATLFFVGDIMLGRSVENFMEAQGVTYPFTKTIDLISAPDVSVGNFEGIVPEIHQKTVPFSFKFSIQAKYLKGLKDVGFDILSLANNHAYDFNYKGLQHTRSLCNEYELTCGGDPLGLNKDSFVVDEVGDYTIGYIFLHTLYKTIDLEQVRMNIEKIKNQSDVLIAYVHWGTEYDLYHNESQEQLAHGLVDAGVDAVIGHHPHVVQDIELYKGKPIFYSLGNYVFDQYFSEDVQEGLGVHMTINDKEIAYKTIGFSSIDTKSQPNPMSRKDTERLFDRIFDKINHENGLFTAPLI